MGKTNFFKSSLMILLLCFGLTNMWGQATLPVSRTIWDTTPIGWTDNGTARTTNFACTGNNGGSLQNTGKYYMVYFEGTPDQLTYSLKTGGISGNSKLEVQESSDGNSWTNVADYQNVTYNTCHEETKQLLSSTRYVRFYYTKGSGNMDIDDVSISQGISSTDPTLSVNPTELSGLTYTEGNGPSAAQTFELTGTSLDGSNVTLTIDAPFEISTSESDGYTDEITLSDYDGEDTTIWVRLAVDQNIGSYTGSIEISGGDADDITIDVVGEVTVYSVICEEEGFEGSGLSNGGYDSKSFSKNGGDIIYACENCYREDISAHIYNGESAVRLRNANGSEFTVTVTNGGIETFSAWVQRWGSGAVYAVEYSVDNGSNWNDVTTLDNTWFNNSNDYKELTFDINSESTSNTSDDDIIVRIKRISGERLLIDDVSWTCYSESCNTPIPTAIDQTLCPESTVADLEADGEELTWYDADNNELTDETTLEDGTTYYVTQTVDGCESDKAGVVVTVGDTEKPIPDVEELEAITAQCEVLESNLTEPTATDNCSGTVTVTNDVENFPITESTTITWTFEDESGNTEIQTQEVIIEDTTKPVPDTEELTAITAQCEVLESNLTEPTATDNCSGTVTVTNDVENFPITESTTITWTFEDESGNTEIQTQEVIIQPSPIADVDINNVTVTYDGNPHQIEVENLPEGAGVSYSIEPETDSNNGAINAGTYTITATVTPPANAVNCEDIELTAILTIEKADFEDITFNDDEFIYDGTEHSITVSGAPEEATVTYDNNGQINAGTYEVTATVEMDNYNDLELTATLTIHKAQAVITTGEVQEYDYDGTVKNVVATLNHNETSLTYSPQQGYTDAGTYEIIVSAAETVNYLAVSEDVTLIIKKADFEDITFNDDEFTYDGEEHSITVSGAPEGATITYENNGQTNAGTYEVTVTIQMENYNDFELTAILTINKAPLTVKAYDISKEYGEDDPVLTYTVTGLVDGDTETTVITGVLLREPGEAVGIYDITQGTLVANDNYEINFEEADFEITKIMLTVTADVEQSKVYGQDDPEFAYTVTGLVNGDLAENVFTGALSREPGEDVGTYEIVEGTLAFAGESNYDFEFVSNDFTITEATLTVTANDTSKVYGEDDPVLTYTVDEDNLVNGDTADVVTGALSRESGEDVGTYPINKGSLDAGGNYEITFIGDDFEIIKATLEGITFENDTFLRDCNEHSLSISGELPEGVTVTYIGNEQSEAGVYTVTVNIDGGNNYNDLTLTAEMTIEEVLPELAAYHSCGAFSVDEIEVNNLPEGWQAKWYATATSTTALETIENSGTYYVVSDINGCESARVPVEITVTHVNVPTGNTNQHFCDYATTDDLILNHTDGSALNFYDEDGTLLEMGAELHNGTYYVTEEINGCESGQFAIEVTITITTAPTVEAQQFCDSATVADLMAEGENIKWYDSQDAATPLADDTALSSGIYFVSQTTNGCESERVAVNVTVTPTPDALFPQTITICGFEVLENVEVGQQPNAELVWYQNEDDTAPMNAHSEVYNGTYYVSQRVGICESDRVAITFVVNDVPEQPTASSQAFCGSAVVSDLIVTGEDGAIFWWFDSATSDEPLASDAALSNGTYYVSQTVGECESERKAISVQIIHVEAPQIDDMNLCEGTIVGEVVIPATTGITYKWYTSPTAITALSENSVLTDGTYYISSVYSGCESERVAVEIEVAPVPAAPTGEPEQAFVYEISTNEVTISDLVVNEDDVLWFAHEDDAATLTNPLQSDMPLEDGSTYYAIIVSEAGCVSEPFAVTVTVTLGNERFDRAKLAYYPNPTQGILNIHYAETIEKVEVYNAVGQLVATQEFNSNQIAVDMHQLSNGTYLLKLHIDGYQQLIKVVKN